MTENSLDLSGKIDSHKLEAIEIIANTADSLSIPFFVIGATARDFILEIGHEIRASRATLDIDLGVRVQNWELYMKLRKGLVGTGKFAETKEAQRLMYQRDLGIDLIPFGPIADRKGSMKWPSDGEIIMNILGFEEAFQNSISARLRSDPLLEIKVASLAGLVVIKMVSWKEKYPQRDKDASDLALIIQSYTDAGNVERIINEESDLLELENFDYVSAGARLLGRDIASILTLDLKDILLEILSEEPDNKDLPRLIIDMMKSDIVASDKYKYIMDILNEVKRGILEKL